MEIRKIYIQTIIIMMAGFLCACGGKKQEEFSLSGAIEGREEPSLAESREDNDKKGVGKKDMIFRLMKTKGKKRKLI